MKDIKERKEKVNKVNKAVWASGSFPLVEVWSKFARP
jgi:5-carboxymethyl-2-hydroxymuconate isomerase